ncbi:non-homologous end-joining DNA ligase [Altererythrobacter sp. CC-YST694]|uniref:non-homologous end-joining DNA ligase n=1 Tax=Altererythrobacter sp. CC-YST694 TaxID=2755038 RepID=UPI00299F7261|nr:non-homologous end-joining DNA ligase [Altererythrobacter sp. CC-YST694]
MARAANHDIEITSRERVVFPHDGLTKGDLADYYRLIAPAMLPFLAGRPVSLVRCPQGIAHCFFQKHHTPSFGPHVLSVEIEEKDGDIEPYLRIESAAGILECVQMGAVEFHLWGSRAPDVERPDRMVFDLDPASTLAFADLASAAREIGERLEGRGLASFPMLTGGKGLHLVVPLTPRHSPRHSWDDHRAFAESFARELAEEQPERFTATMSKQKRKGKIFIDWLRNTRGATAIAPYSARARDGATLAAPVSWEELAGMEELKRYTLADAAELLKRAKALKGWGEVEQYLPG